MAFTAHVTPRGYMIHYKGRPIGGAGTLPGAYARRAMHWRHARANVAMYREMIAREISDLQAGRGAAYMRAAMAEIDAGGAK